MNPTNNTAEKATEEPRVFSGRGILFAVIDDRETMPPGATSTIDIITAAIEEALADHPRTPRELTQYLVTSAFQHTQDRRIQFNSVLKAGDVVGANILPKLYNAYRGLVKLADETTDPLTQEDIRTEARGFAAALQIVISPFSVEDSNNSKLVNWDKLDRLVEEFMKEQDTLYQEHLRTP